MKPIRILIFFLAVTGLLFLIALVFPREGIRIGEEFTLKFRHYSDLFSRDSISGAYTDSIIKYTKVNEDPESEITDTLLYIPDTISDAALIARLDSLIKARIDSIGTSVFPIEFSNEGLKDLYAFFRNAESARERGEVVRVLHFGDSQIENDRMTNLLRYRFQKVFGGSGCGMVPAIPLYSGNPVFQEDSGGEWIRFTGFGKKDTTLDHSCYGVLGCFTSVQSAEDELPYLDFTFREGRRASDFSELGIYLHSYSDSGYIALHLNDSISDTLTIVQEGYQVREFDIHFEPQTVTMEFYLPEGGRIYGLSFDSESGVQFDNIAMRGSAGLDFSKSDRQLLDTMMQQMNPGLFLLQFGGNVVPYLNSASFYKRTFKREVKYLQDLFPEVAIIVIGPSDMATKENGAFLTYPMLEPVRDVLREVALETGCAFWDMYEAMGGRNSIQEFVRAEPPLASTDYIHFTQKGANMMAGMFSDALMLEYRKFTGQ
ncbi:hypothetical protein ACFLT1_08590 [Bacteroidota bacterium]